MNIAIPKTKISHVLLKVILMNVVNLFVLGGIVFLLQQLPRQAQHVKTVSTEIQGLQEAADVAVLKSDIERNKEKIDALTATLAADKTVIFFITRMDEIKKTTPDLQYEFPITTEVPDKSGLKGLPISITMKGTKKAISDAFIAVGKIPVFMKPITFSMAQDETGVYNAKFGGFLYDQ